MKIEHFISFKVAAYLLIPAFFIQPAAAQNSKLSKTNFETCKVRKNNANFFVSATEKTVRLKKGTLLSWTIPDLHQGLIPVKAKIGKKWIKGEILLDDTTCN